MYASGADIVQSKTHPVAFPSLRWALLPSLALALASLNSEGERKGVSKLACQRSGADIMQDPPVVC